MAEDRPTTVLLLRGINVGGRHPVPMAELRELLDGLGLGPSRTHLQSGNALVQVPAGLAVDADRGGLDGVVAQALEARFGFPVPVVSRSGAQLASVVQRLPFPEAADRDPTLVHVLFLTDEPDGHRVGAVDPGRWRDEDWRVDGRELFVHYRHGSARSKLTVDDVERVLDVRTTGRNWRTVRRLAEVAAGG